MPSRLALLFFLLGCQNPAPARELNGQTALGYAKTQVDFGPRIPGTEGHVRTAQWLDSLLRARADSVIVQAWTHVDKKGDSLPMRNFIGRFNPGATRRLLFLAHWDTRPVADADTGAQAKQPVPGANDGASGVAVLLAMADALKAAPPKIGVDLLFVDGEDYGIFAEEVDVLIGSKHYAKNPAPGPTPEYAVLLDMVGAKGAKFQKEGYSLTGAPGVVELVWRAAARSGHSGLFLDTAGGSLTDDHIPLQQAGIRAIDVVPQVPADYPFWHTVNDTVDKLSAETLRAVGDVMMTVIREARQVR